MLKAYTTINYKDLSLEEVEKIGIRIHHIEGRDNGMLFNGRTILSVPMDCDDFNIKEYLEQNKDITNCNDNLEKFIIMIKQLIKQEY